MSKHGDRINTKTLTPKPKIKPVGHNETDYSKDQFQRNRESDPTLHHCQHKIAEMNNYTFCPECGERFIV